MHRAGGWLVVLALLAGRAEAAEIIHDSFMGSSLGTRWAWVNEDACAGAIGDGLVLNPQSPFRQAAVGTAKNAFSWVSAGNQRSYQFTVAEWNIRTNSNVSARLFLVGDEAGAQPDAFSDFNKPNVIMAKLDRWQGVFYFNLFAKEGEPQRNVDEDDRKLSWLTIGESVEGCTFGVTLNRSRAYIWWKSADGKKTAAQDVPIPSASFASETTFYVGAKNDTGDTFGPDQTIRISNAAVTP